MSLLLESNLRRRGWWKTEVSRGIAARLWPLHFGSVKNYSVGPDADPPKGQILAVTEAPVRSHLEALLWHHSLQAHSRHLARWLTRITFDLPPSLSSFQISGRRFLMGCAFPGYPRGGKMWGRTLMSVCLVTSKMPSLLVLAGSQGCYMYLKKVSYACEPQTGIVGTEHTWLSFWFSQLYIFRGKKCLKHDIGSVNMNILSYLS